jgi:hypothetical protein
MSKTYNSQNIEKEVLGEVFELPKKPFNAIPLNENFIFDRGAKMIYGSIINLKK